MKFVNAIAQVASSALLMSSRSNAFTFMTAPHSHQQHQSALQAEAEGSPSQLEQLSRVTTLSIDSGDLNVIEQYAKTGFITDATTNPLFVSQAGLSGDPVYAKLVDDAVSFAVENENKDDTDAIVALAIDRLAVNLGSSILQFVDGYVSTEVNPKLAFDTEASIERGKRIIAMYEEMGVPKNRVLIKLPATWESILAAEVLERDYGIQCNLTLIFSFVQGVACAQRGAHLISPFPGRVLDWYKKTLGRADDALSSPEDDEGVICCKRLYNYYKKFGHDTICMPASWRPSRGAGYELDEIQALAGTDRMTIPAPLLEKLETTFEDLPQALSVEDAMKSEEEEMVGSDEGGMLNEKEFRYLLNMDGCGTDKLAEGLRAFIAETEKLEEVISAKVKSALELPASA
eukprot:CAMPEP_0203635458 /NCGR_PEP_ID=MMETSP0088-20131115/2236_1 /ASSEMBLY_ACC=CAM_ASM_001087 /TAXON_ID=426623 /ORGANISM="Chaetoceros affinis, Strain CCMP159" /LENGTH=401 /DNA_ID=CAMNT_0050489347 /DNA_START=41 /DNA_END=1246 /DNA_ORIENTATION=+